MCVYCRAASAVLDALWEDPGFREDFTRHGYDLADLGKLVHDVFVPAYLDVKRALQGGPLEMLEAQVTDDVLGPLADRPSFRALWAEWDPPTRQAFLREQSEMQLGLLIVAIHENRLAGAYKAAFLKVVE
jgi:hypothetical protein